MLDKSLFITESIPEFHKIAAIVIEEANSMIGKKMELYHTVLIHAFLCLALIASNF